MDARTKGGIRMKRMYMRERGKPIEVYIVKEEEK